MPRYQGTNDMRVMAPDVNPVQLNPSIGIYQDGHGTSLTRLGNYFESVGNARYNARLDAEKAALEAEGARQWTDALIEDTELGMQTAIGALNAAVLQAGGTEEDVADVLEGRKDASKLREMGIQNPHSVMSEIYRGRNLIRRVLRNPKFAPEIEEAYRVGGGKAVGTGLRESTQAAANPLDLLYANINKEAFNIGLNEGNSDFNTRYNAVVRNQAAKAEYDAEVAKLALTSQRLELGGNQALEILNKSSSAQMTITHGDIGGILQTVHANDNLDTRKAAIDQLRELRSAKLAEARAKFNNYGITQAEIESALGSSLSMIDTAIEQLMGDEDLKLVQNSMDLLVGQATLSAAQSPGAKEAIGVGALVKLMPDTWASALKMNARFTKLVNSIIDTGSNEASLRAVFNGMTPFSREESVRFMQDNRAFFQRAAESSDITDDQFGRLTSNLYSSYVLGGNAARIFHDNFATLASDKVIERLSKVQDSTVRSNLQTNISRYVDDLVTEAFVSVGEEARVQMIGVGGARYKWDKVKDLVDVTYSTSGVPSFTINEKGAKLTTQEGADELRAAVSRYNSAGTKIGQAVNILQRGLGLYQDKSPSELAQTFVEKRVAPGYLGEEITATYDLGDFF